MKKRIFKPSGKRGIFDEHYTKQKLTSIGNPLEAIDKLIDFEMFRPTLEEKLD